MEVQRNADQTSSVSPIRVVTESTVDTLLKEETHPGSIDFVLLPVCFPYAPWRRFNSQGLVFRAGWGVGVMELGEVHNQKVD